MKTIAYLTHTDIAKDSRILKSIQVCEEIDQLNVVGLGLTEESFQNNSTEKNVHNKELKSRRFYKKLKRINRIMLMSSIVILLEYIAINLKFLFRNKPHIIHANDYLALIPAYIYKRFRKTLIIYDAHELESEKNGIKWLSSKLVKKFEKQAWKDVDYFITVSNSIFEWYKKNYGVKNGCVIMNSPSIKGEEKKIDLHEKYNIDKRKIIAVYVGLLVPGRGINNILKLAEKKQDIQFLFIGEGALLDQIQKKARELDNISHENFVKHEEVVSYLRGADVGLCLLENISLSDYYAIPNKLLEYAFAGLYVVATDFPEMNNIVGKYKLGSLIPENLDKNQNKLAFPTKEDVKRYKMLFSEKKIEELSWPSQKEKLKNAYIELM